MRVIIIGRTAVGKTTVARELHKLKKWKTIEVSKIVASIANTTKSQGREKLIEEKDKHKNDPDWLWRPLEKNIPVNQSCIITGIREPYLYYKIKELYQDVILLKVTAPDLVRYCRLCSLQGYIPIDKFKSFEEKADEMGLDILLNAADYTIDTNESIDNIINKLTKFLIQYNNK